MVVLVKKDRDVTGRFEKEEVRVLRTGRAVELGTRKLAVEVCGAG